MGLENSALADLTGKLTEHGHQLLARVYYADTDSSGTVHHARYVEFLERGRDEYWRLLTQKSGPPIHGIVGFVVHRLQIAFMAPAHIDDLLMIGTRITYVKGARVRITQTIERGGDALVLATVETVAVNVERRPRRFPLHLIAGLQAG